MSSPITAHVGRSRESKEYYIVFDSPELGPATIGSVCPTRHVDHMAAWIDDAMDDIVEYILAVYGHD